jgi:hypothetical protein
MSPRQQGILWRSLPLGIDPVESIARFSDSRRASAAAALDELMRVARITQEMLKFYSQDGKLQLTLL